MTVLAEEIETPGDGPDPRADHERRQPGAVGARRRRASSARSARSTSWSSIDPYLNETTRLAHVILPPTSPLERSHYDVALNAFAVRNVAKYSPPLFERAGRRAPRLGDLPRAVARLGAARRLGRLARVVERVLGRLGPEAIVDLALRTGPHGGCCGCRSRSCARAPHGLDLGPLEPRLPGRLAHAATAGSSSRRATLPRRPAAPRAPARGAAAPPAARADRPPPPAQQQLVDAQQRAAREGAAALHAADPPRRRRARAGSSTAAARAGRRPRRGAIELPVEVTDEMMRGVVSVPHGWGHGRSGVAAARRGARRRARASTTSSIRARIDELSGTSALTGQPVEVAPHDEARSRAVRQDRRGGAARGDRRLLRPRVRRRDDRLHVRRARTAST